MAAIQCLSSCFNPPRKLSITTNNRITSSSSKSSLSFFSHFSDSTFSHSSLAMKVVERPMRRSIVCEVATSKKADSAVKRAKQAEKRRIYNKSKKSEMKTRMRKVLDSLEVLQKSKEPQSEEIVSIEKLIAEAYSAIDKAVKAGALHKNTGANRKSRLARRKKAVEIHHGWYTPASSPTPASSLSV